MPIEYYLSNPHASSCSFNLYSKEKSLFLVFFTTIYLSYAFSNKPIDNHLKPPQDSLVLFLKLLRLTAALVSESILSPSFLGFTPREQAPPITSRGGCQGIEFCWFLWMAEKIKH